VEVIFGNLISLLLKPPGMILFLMLVGLVTRQRFYRTGQSLIYLAMSLLLLFSMPIVSRNMTQWYENMPVLDETGIKDAAAIVILGAGRYRGAPEYGGDTISRYALERIRYGAHLQRKTKLPILVSGGNVYDTEAIPEAELMQQVLEKDFLLVTRWVENQSRTTYENAVFTQAMLSTENIKHIILVTHALHMPRAREAFEQAGFIVTPAPLGYHTTPAGPWLASLIPHADSLELISSLFNEWIGRLWYRLRYY